MYRRAFSMVELLAVVAVIMVLLSILFPLWAGMRIKSTRLADMSNMRNFASACVASARSFVAACSARRPPSRLWPP